MSKLTPGSVIDSRFEIVEEIGHGGMGIVYRARQADFARDVAIKVLRDALSFEPDKMKRFQREAHVISKLDHPNIVKIYAVGQQDGLPYIAMEYLQGRQLSEVIQQTGPIHWKRALPLFMQACDALAYAHERQIIHRDIKPSNIVVTQDSEGNFSNAKIVDFGIAKSLTETDKLTRTEMVLGSVFYLSPGQFQGRAPDPLADIYSLGCTFFEVLAGQPAFSGDTVFDTIAQKSQNEIPDVNSLNPSAQIPDSLQQLLTRMMQSDGNLRPQSALQVKTLLQKIEAGQTVDLSNLPKPARQPRRGKGILKVGLVVLVASIGCAVFVFFAKAKDPPMSVPHTITGMEREANLIARMESGHQGAMLAGDYYDLAIHYLSNGYPEAAAIASEQGLKSLPSVGDRNTLSDLNYTLACAMDELGEWDQAFPHLMEAEKYHTRDYAYGAADERVVNRMLAGSFADATRWAHSLYEREHVSSRGEEAARGALHAVYPATVIAPVVDEAYARRDDYKQAALYRVKKLSNDTIDLVNAELLPALAEMQAHHPIDNARWNKLLTVAACEKEPYYHEFVDAYVALGETLRGNHSRAQALLIEDLESVLRYKKPFHDSISLIHQKQMMRQFCFGVLQRLPAQYQEPVKPYVRKLDAQIQVLVDEAKVARQRLKLPVQS